MKIAYIVLCHKSPELVAAIVNKVTLGTENIAVIHVDGGAVDEATHMTNESMLNLTYFEYPKYVREFDSPDEISADKKKDYLYVRKIGEKYIACCMDAER